MSPRLSIALAVQGGASCLPEWLDLLDAQRGEGVQVLVCFAPGEAGVSEVCRQRSWVEPVEGAPGSLIPHLWRDGILRAAGPRVALSNVQCRPEPGWVDALLRADLARFAGVAGAIDNDPNADGCGCAIFLLRYVRYARPFAPRETGDLPGDNVVYDRGVLLEHTDSFADGFWEPSIHAQLMREGHRLLLDPSIAVTYVNGYGVRQFARLRFAHGRHYGRDRAATMSLGRHLLYLAFSPAIPLVFGAKILRAAFTKPAARRALPRALPTLLVFLSAWAAGEIAGVLDGLRARSRIS